MFGRGRTPRVRTGESCIGQKKGPASLADTGPCEKIPGSVLLSHHGNAAVPSAQEGLTAVFGMGTGVAPPP